MFAKVAGPCRCRTPFIASPSNLPTCRVGDGGVVHVNIHPAAGYDHFDVVPPVLPERCPRLILRKKVPERDTVSLGSVLHACPEDRTARIGPKLFELEVLLGPADGKLFLAAPPDRIDVELDGSVAERDVFSTALPLFSRNRP